MVQYLAPEEEEERRKLSDRRAKVAAKKRIKQRKTRRLIVIGSLLVVAACLYFVATTVPALRDPLTKWMTGEKQAAIQNTSGIRKTMKGENRRRRLVDVNGETSLDDSVLP